VACRCLAPACHAWLVEVCLCMTLSCKDFPLPKKRKKKKKVIHNHMNHVNLQTRILWNFPPSAAPNQFKMSLLDQMRGIPSRMTPSSQPDLNPSNKGINASSNGVLQARTVGGNSQVQFSVGKPTGGDLLSFLLPVIDPSESISTQGGTTISDS
jgi:hypothetical protein